VLPGGGIENVVLRKVDGSAAAVSELDSARLVLLRQRLDCHSLPTSAVTSRAAAVRRTTIYLVWSDRPSTRAPPTAPAPGAATDSQRSQRTRTKQIHDSWKNEQGCQ
jgi:hypothetical protein